ncbi:MAG: SH3 domain-containing protein [Kofleriaceae bacterium]
MVTLASLLASIVLFGDVSAEVRRTTTETTLRKKPGEKAAKVAKLPKGTEVTVLSTQGRWLRVKTRKGEGYLTRTTVTSSEKAEPDVRAWSTQHRPASEAKGQSLSLYVEASTANGVLLAEPRAGAPEVSTVPQGALLAVIDAASTAGWVHARDEQGKQGWIAREHLDNGESAVVVAGAPGDAVARRDEPAAFVRSEARALAVRAELGLGFRSLGMDLTSNAAGGLRNYLMDADAVAMTMDADVVLRAKRYLAAGDVRAQLTTSSPGIDYPGPTSQAGKIPFSTVSLDVGARVGRRVGRVFDLAARVGVHYDAFLPKDVDNVGTLPRERLAGATAGARINIVPPNSRFSADVRLDGMIVGSRAQTAGLEDGTDNDAGAWWGGLTVRYVVSRRLSMFLGYDFARFSTTWSGMSMRQPGVTRTSRVDTSQLGQVGVSAEL